MRHPFSLIAIAVVLVILAVVSQIPQTIVYAKEEPVEVEEPEPDPEPYVFPPPESLPFVSITAEEPPHELMLAEVSAYTSSVDETDSTPDINAMGTNPGPGSVACPTRYKFGTKVFINGDEFVCDDRMNPRYADGNYFDIWTETKAEAMHWGRRTVEVRVIE